MADIGPAERIIVNLGEDEPAPALAPGALDAAGVVVVPEDGEDAAAALPKRAVKQEDGRIRLPLLYPVTLRYKRPSSEEVREERVDALVFGRMNGADMRAIAAAAKGDQGQMVTLARSARISEGKFRPIFDMMDAADLDDAFSVVATFLGTGRQTGR